MTLSNNHVKVIHHVLELLAIIFRKIQHYCLSSAMHGQNINLPVCVCVSVTLSVNFLTGQSQTPQRVFTADSLKDADLRKDMPFGVSMMNNHI